MDKDIVLQILENFIHQIINPIGGVAGTLDNIADGTIQPDKVRQRANAARSQLEQVVSLVRNLDFFVKFLVDPNFQYDGKYFKPCVIPKLLIESMQFYQEQANKFSITLQLLNREDQYTVYGNPDLLRQVFMNIFDNAVKYSSSHTDVKVSMRVQRGTRKLIIEFRSQSSEIENDEKELIFNYGYRGKYAKQKTSSGSGLGLFICKIIVEKIFEGEIRMEYSKAQKTAITFIYFPRWKCND